MIVYLACYIESCVINHSDDDHKDNGLTSLDSKIKHNTCSKSTKKKKFSKKKRKQVNSKEKKTVWYTDGPELLLEPVFELGEQTFRCVSAGFSAIFT